MIAAATNPSANREEHDLQAVARVAHAEIEQRVRENPYLAVAAGVGVGAVLGGGVPNWALRLGATALSRMAMGYVLAQLATEEDITAG